MASCRRFFLSTSCTTGTSNPRSVSTAMPMWQYFKLGDVRLVVLRHARDCCPGVTQVLRRLAPDRFHRLTLDLAPARKIGKGHGRNAGCGPALRGDGHATGDDLLGVPLEIFRRNAPRRA